MGHTIFVMMWLLNCDTLSWHNKQSQHTYDDKDINTWRKPSHRLSRQIIRLHYVSASILNVGDHDFNHDPQGHNLNKDLDREEVMDLVLQQ